MKTLLSNIVLIDNEWAVIVSGKVYFRSIYGKNAASNVLNNLLNHSLTPEEYNNLPVFYFRLCKHTGKKIYSMTKHEGI